MKWSSEHKWNLLQGFCLFTPVKHSFYLARTSLTDLTLVLSNLEALLGHEQLYMFTISCIHVLRGPSRVAHNCICSLYPVFRLLLLQASEITLADLTRYYRTAVKVYWALFNIIRFHSQIWDHCVISKSLSYSYIYIYQMFIKFITAEAELNDILYLKSRRQLN